MRAELVRTFRGIDPLDVEQDPVEQEGPGRELFEPGSAERHPVADAVRQGSIGPSPQRVEVPEVDVPLTDQTRTDPTSALPGPFFEERVVWTDGQVAREITRLIRQS